MSKELTFEDVSKLVSAHVKARKWDKTNDARGLAISLSLETNELLEYFQWQGKPFGNKEDLASELADIFIYAIQFADRYDINITEAIRTKLEKTAKKYPAELFEIENKTARKTAWLAAKRQHKKDTTL